MKKILLLLSLIPCYAVQASSPSSPSSPSRPSPARRFTRKFTHTISTAFSSKEKDEALAKAKKELFEFGVDTDLQAFENFVTEQEDKGR